MIKALLISDTHGDIGIINKLAAKTSADLVIHAGDFGFYNESSYKHLSNRELLLLVSHSPYWKNYRVNKQTERDELIKIVKEHELLGDFADYQHGHQKFIVPVYAVYGNHEDVFVVRQLKEQPDIHNFYLLDEDNVYDLQDTGVGKVRLFGIGGNFLPSKKLLDKPIAGKAGKIWATLHQFGSLYQKLGNCESPAIFVSHVSPGKEPLLTRMILHFMPNIWISGHMGAPYTCVWNQFTIHEENESQRWLDEALSTIDALPTDKLMPEAQLAYELIQKELPDKHHWFKKLWNINLPDVENGYAVLTFERGKFTLDSHSYLHVS